MIIDVSDQVTQESENSNTRDNNLKKKKKRWAEFGSIVFDTVSISFVIVMLRIELNFRKKKISWRKRYEGNNSDVLIFIVVRSFLPTYRNRDR